MPASKASWCNSLNHNARYQCHNANPCHPCSNPMQEQWVVASAGCHCLLDLVTATLSDLCQDELQEAGEAAYLLVTPVCLLGSGELYNLITCLPHASCCWGFCNLITRQPVLRLQSICLCRLQNLCSDCRACACLDYSSDSRRA